VLAWRELSASNPFRFARGRQDASATEDIAILASPRSGKSL
jgi:hypothetical protein